MTHGSCSLRCLSAGPRILCWLVVEFCISETYTHTHQPHHYTGHSVYTDGQRAGETAAMAAPLPSMKQADAVFLETREHHLPMWLHSEQGLEHSVSSVYHFFFSSGKQRQQ